MTGPDPAAPQPSAALPSAALPAETLTTAGQKVAFKNAAGQIVSGSRSAA